MTRSRWRSRCSNSPMCCSDDDLIDDHRQPDRRTPRRHCRPHAGAGAGRRRHRRTRRARLGDPLVRNPNAELGQQALERLVERAAIDAAIAADLRGRERYRLEEPAAARSNAAGDKVLRDPCRASIRASIRSLSARCQAVVYNRMRNRAGFSSQEWKVAYNQVKALSDRTPARRARADPLRPLRLRPPHRRRAHHAAARRPRKFSSSGSPCRIMWRSPWRSVPWASSPTCSRP